MASFSQFSQCIINKTSPRQQPTSFTNPNFHINFLHKMPCFRLQTSYMVTRMPNKSTVILAKIADEEQQQQLPRESKSFVEEMRSVAMKLHSKQHAKEGEKEAKEPEQRPVAKWEPSINGYLRFLVDIKMVYNTLEEIIEKAVFPSYAEFRNTGLERSEKLKKDLEWFREQGHVIPDPSSPGVTYSEYLNELSEKNPYASICHFYNIYIGHTAGGRMIGAKVAEELLNKEELEFYKWDADLSQLQQNVKEKLNQVAESWSREEKNKCLEEAESSFKYSRAILRLIVA